MSSALSILTSRWKVNTFIGGTTAIPMLYYADSKSSWETTMTTPAPSPQSASQDTISRTFSIEGDVRMLERMKKQADTRGFTIMCDEREPMGENTAPPPLAYFISSILF